MITTSIDSGLSAGSTLQVLTVAERTSQAVVDLYTQLVQSMKAVQNVPPANVSTGAFDGLLAAMNGLRALAQYGLVQPNPDNPSGPQVTRYVTNEMAKNIDLLSRTLRAVGIVSDSAYLGGLSSAQKITLVQTWQDLSSQGLSEIMESALVAAKHNASFQAMIELQYVQAGNEVLQKQLDDLDRALSATKAVTDLLSQLQVVHNYITAGTRNANPINQFTDPGAAVAANQQFLFELLGPAERTYLGITDASQITAATYKSSFNSKDISFNGRGVLGNLLYRLLSPSFAANNNGITDQQIVDAFALSPSAAFIIDRDTNNKITRLRNTGTAITLATADALLNLLTDDQKYAITEDLNGGQGTPPLTAQQIMNSFNSGNFDVSASTIPDASQLGVKGILLQNALFQEDGPDKLTKTKAAVAALYNAGVAVNPAVRLYSERVRLVDSLTVQQLSMWNIDVSDYSIGPSNSQISVPIVDLSTRAGTGSANWLTWVYGDGGLVSIFNLAGTLTNLNTTDNLGNPIPNRTTLPSGILANLTSQQRVHLGLTNPADPGLDANAQPNSSTKTYDQVSQQLFGTAIDPEVDFKNQSPQDVLMRTYSIRDQLAAQLAILDQISPPPASGRDLTSIGGKIATVLDDLYRYIGDTLTANSAPITQTNALDGLRAWIMDNQDKHATDSNPVNQALAKNAGDIQRNIQDAMTAATNLNDKQKNDFSRYMFIFQEFYQSAAAMLTALTQMIQKIAQNAGR